MIHRAARWLMPAPDAEAVTALAGELGIFPLTARILVHRGYGHPSAARTFLDPSLDDLLDPRLMRGLAPAVERLQRALRDRDPILLYGDYDVDGTASIVILKKALEILGADAAYHVPHRLRDGYGMRPEVIRDAAARGVRLIVSVDTGIRAHDVVATASALGVDVIVTDHHLPDGQAPSASAVLNPNQPGCDYPEKNLCGAGVTFKLVQALLEASGLPPVRRTRLLESFLKLVAIATVADVVPLTGENRVIVKHGLAGLTATPNPGLRALLEVAGFPPGQAPTAGQVAFRVAPRINAAGRMAHAKDVIEMFLTSDTERARHLAAELHTLNQERQQTEAAMLAQALEECQKVTVDDSLRGLVFAGLGWHRGVAGIVASRLVERYCRPVFVLGIDESEGVAQGSGRSVPGIHLLEALESMPGILTKFGGHRQAAGVTLPADRISAFREAFNEFVCRHLPPEELCPRYEIDALAAVDELTPESVTQLQALAPFGFGNPAPLVAVEGMLDSPPAIMKDQHLRFRVSGARSSLVVKAWQWAGREARLPTGRPLQLAVTVDLDSYTGVAAVLKDVREAQS